MTLTALPYYGGKSNASGASSRVGPWVASMLPTDCESYVETHAGMLGVMLARRAAPNEVANDLNGRIVNWWLCVRDHNEELIDLFEATPISDDLFADYRSSLDEGEPLMRALKFMYVVVYGVMHGDGHGSQRPATNTTRNNHSTHAKPLPAKIRALRQRTLDIHFTNRPAIDLLDRFKNASDAVIYVDPPYRTSYTHPYAIVRFDDDETLALLRRQAGRVAVSGYGDEWDGLLDSGWHRFEYRTHITVAGRVGRKLTGRTEVLWTNYKPEVQEALL